MASAACSFACSLNPVHKIIGMSGRISINCLASFNPLICGMVMSVITTSNFCGFARNASSASIGLVLVST